METVERFQTIAGPNHVVALPLQNLHHHFTGDGRIFDHQNSAHWSANSFVRPGRLALVSERQSPPAASCVPVLFFIIASAGDAEFFLRNMALGLVAGLIAAISLAGGDQALAG